MPLISHRGATGLAPENSLEGIRIAESYKPDFIEIDVHRTSDGVFVLYHGEIKQAYSGNNLPDSLEHMKTKYSYLVTLNELLNTHISCPLLLDVKCKEATDKLIDEITAGGLPEDSGFTSPHQDTLFTLKKAFKGAPTFISQPYHHGPIAAIEIARDYGFSGISINKWWLGPIITAVAKHYKKDVMVYTLNNIVWMQLAHRLFKHVYVCTDYPDRYRKHVKKAYTNE